MSTNEAPAVSPRLNIVITKSIEDGIEPFAVKLTTTRKRTFSKPQAIREAIRIGFRSMGIDVSDAEPGDDAPARPSRPGVRKARARAGA